GAFAPAFFFPPCTPHAATGNAGASCNRDTARRSHCQADNAGHSMPHSPPPPIRRLLSCCACAALLLAGCDQNSQQAQQAPPQVTVTTVQPQLATITSEL